MQSSWNLSAVLTALVNLILLPVIHDIYVHYLTKALHSRYGSNLAVGSILQNMS